MNSKFGTLLLLKGPVQVEPRKPVEIQAGRTVLSFRVKAPTTCCCCQEKAPGEARPSQEEIDDMVKKVGAALNRSEPAHNEPGQSVDDHGFVE